MSRGGAPRWLFTVLPLILLLAALTAACGDEESAGGGGGDQPDGGGDQSNGCATSIDCNAEPGMEGTLCASGVCQGCASTAECQSDPEYGVDVLCNTASRCVSCASESGVGCPCGEDNPCTDGFCVDGQCEDCEPGGLGCVCNEDGTCEVGARCDGDVLCEVCPEGEEGCPCADGTCGEGLACLMDLCAPESCEAPGEEGCPCDEDNTCNEGLGCHDDGFCSLCAADALGCECDPVGDGCSMDLACDADAETCRAPITCVGLCAERQVCEEGTAGEDAYCEEDCEGGYVWYAAGEECRLPTCQAADPVGILNECISQHRRCLAFGDGAICDACGTGYIEDNGACRAVLTCGDVGDTCADELRGCTESDGRIDATCGACFDPLVEDDGLDCVIPNEANCILDDDLNLADFCAAFNQTCEPSDDGPASCGGCVLGSFVNPDTGACEAQRSCNEAGCAALGRLCEGEPFATCGACLGDLRATDPSDPVSACADVITCAHLDCGEDFCAESETGGDATCVAARCGPGEAFNESAGVDGRCVSCQTLCCQYDANSGECTPLESTTGRFYLNTRGGTDSCICETLPGYYFDSSLALTGQPCDEDGDGWVRSSARSFVNHSDATLRANARCDVRSIDSFTLINELQQIFEVKICDELDNLLRGEEDGECAPPLLVELYEETLQDRDDGIEGISFPTFQVDGVGRRPWAVEVNPLTKSCIDTSGDYNRNGAVDFEEAHGVSPEGVDLTDEEVIFSHFSYFVELHRGWYEPRPLAGHGTYVIEERSRCDLGLDGGPDFALGYADTEVGDYWRQCTRNRRPSYDLENSTSGYDFARWSCAAEVGGCEVPPPPTFMTPNGFVPEHGLCEVPHPPDDVWRGMNHHSQFRCVEVVGSNPDAGHQLLVGDFYDTEGSPDRAYVINTCGYACDGEDCSNTHESSGLGANPNQPILNCAQPGVPSVGDVGFVSVRYHDDDGMGYVYDEGCIDESQFWPQLCPGWDINPGKGTVVDGRPNDFGSLACGCGVNYGGLNCEIGCPVAAVNDTYDPVPRDGIWMCAEVQASSEESVVGGPVHVGTDPDTGDDFVLRGAVRQVPFVREPLCENPDECSTGFRVY